MGQRERSAGEPVTDVTVVIPTFNEAGNIGMLVERLSHLLDPHSTEVLIVDDSVDDTAAVASAAAERVPHSIRVIHRLDALGGLSGAVLVGLRLAAHPWVVVMDGDLQHPPEDVPRLVATGRAQGADIVVASRYRQGGSAGGLDGSVRHIVSTASGLAARALFPRRLRGCSDPMTGFFAVRRDALTLESLQPQGFKILLEVLVRHRLQVAEIPFVFGTRPAGVSKATMANGTAYLRQLLALRLRTTAPERDRVAVDAV